MFGIVRPNPAFTKSATAVEAMEPIVIEEEGVHKDRATEPIRPPTPTAPSQAAEEASEVNAGTEAEAIGVARVI